MDELITVARQIGWCWCWPGMQAEDSCDLNIFELRSPAVFWVMGPILSGKSTLAKNLALATKFQLVQVSTLIKERAEKDEYEGNLIKESMNNKQPIFDELVVRLIKETIQNSQETAKGYIIDGFPINIGQARLFEFVIGKPSIVIYLNASLAACLHRNTKNKTRDQTAEHITTDFVMSSDKCRQVYVAYEMKTIKIREDKPSDEICRIIMGELIKFWGFTFDIELNSPDMK